MAATRRKPEDVSWMDHGNCRGMDPDLFMPSNDESTPQALAACSTCMVRSRCLAYAQAHHEKGVWGGTTTRQRLAIRRKKWRAQDAELTVEQKRARDVLALDRMGSGVARARASAAAGGA